MAGIHFLSLESGVSEAEALADLVSGVGISTASRIAVFSQCLSMAEGVREHSLLCANLSHKMNPVPATFSIVKNTALKSKLGRNGLSFIVIFICYAGKPRKELKSGSEAEVREEHCLLAYSLWLHSASFLI